MNALIELAPLEIDLSTLHLTDDQFYQLCISNPDLHLERTSPRTTGKISIDRA
jgi:hypothetical protein